MSYLVLARKWRPHQFSEMVGQEHVVRALTHALDSGRIHHAFLFTGTRGVGKTTVARIFAKSLNCETGVSGSPCGVCSACREIDEGRFVDLLEVDAASRTKVEDTRDLLENVQYAPSRGRYKVYLIDEVHMLSAHSFNALLKTLEEPPPHVKFLLATTDPQKLPVTVLSRCLQFHLKRLTPVLIAERMRFILQAESIAFESAALPLLARAADGSVRDALSLLDQVLVFGAGQVLEADVRSMLGTLDRGHVLKVLERLSERDAPGLIAAAREFATHAPDYDQVLAEIASLLVRVALLQTVPDSLEEGMQEWEPSLLAPLASSLPAEDVQLYYQMALMGRRDLAHAPDPQTGFEMTLLRMLAFRPATDAAPTPGAVAPAAINRQTASTSTRTSSARSSASPTISPASLSAAPLPRASASPEADSAATLVDENDWQSLVKALKLSGAALQLAANCVLRQREGSVLRLLLDPKVSSLRTPACEERLTVALSQYFKTPMRLDFVAEDLPASAPLDTPARRQAQAVEERLNTARADLETDPTVRALKDKFGGALQADSVRPLL